MKKAVLSFEEKTTQPCILINLLPNCWLVLNIF